MTGISTVTSVAVVPETVMVALPALVPLAVIVTFLPFRAAVATLSSELITVRVSSVLVGSTVMVTSAVAPVLRVTLAGLADRLFRDLSAVTVTVHLPETEAVFTLVAVISASPSATAVTTTLPFTTSTVATLVSLEVHVT